MVRRVIAVLVANGPSAQTSVSPRPQRTPLFDARLQAVVATGGTVYMGGEFVCAADLADNLGSNNQLAAIDPGIAGLRPWSPSLTSAYVPAVNAAANMVYPGVDVSTVGHLTRNRLSAVNPSLGALLEGGDIRLARCSAVVERPMPHSQTSSRQHSTGCGPIPTPERAAKVDLLVRVLSASGLAS